MTTPETPTPPQQDSEPVYAMNIANGSYDWYRRAAVKSRRYYRLTESLQLLLSAAVPVSAVISPGSAEVPAVLGGVLVVLTGLRSVFHWQDDYLRFSRARETVEAERRLYLTGSEPYDDEATRDQRLVAAVTRIEQREMGVWVRLASTRDDSTRK